VARIIGRLLLSLRSRSGVYCLLSNRSSHLLLFTGTEPSRLLYRRGGLLFCKSGTLRSLVTADHTTEGVGY